MRNRLLIHIFTIITLDAEEIFLTTFLVRILNAEGDRVPFRQQARNGKYLARRGEFNFQAIQPIEDYGFQLWLIELSPSNTGKDTGFRS